MEILLISFGNVKRSRNRVHTIISVEMIEALPSGLMNLTVYRASTGQYCALHKQKKSNILLKANVIARLVTVFVKAGHPTREVMGYNVT